MFWRKKEKKTVVFEESLDEEWDRDAGIVEVPLGNRPFLYLGLAIAVIALSVAVKILIFAANGSYYNARATANATQSKTTAAPRGIIYDREGNILAESKAAFTAILDPHEFLENENLQTSTFAAVQDIFGISSDTVWSLIKEGGAQDFATPIVLSENVNQNQLVNLQALNLPTLIMKSDFERAYPAGQAFSTVLGYVSRVSGNDIKTNPILSSDDFIGKTGIEAFYDNALRGTPGVDVAFRNAQGNILTEEVKSQSVIGHPLQLTIDGDLQSYFYSHIQSELSLLGRRVGIGLAMNPQTGEILSLVALPGFDNNIFSSSGNSAEIKNLLTSPDEPLFNRVVSGLYNPGSTIKPLDGVAALHEGVIDSTREIFSPGYLLVPNPYNSSTPGRYLDWKYQGKVDLASALAQSSDVYFYIVGGGSPPTSIPLLNDSSDYGVSGLGINRLHNWWGEFGLGKPTGIDLPGEESGFLPTPEWKQRKLGTPWLLGDTYNVSIGQGDLLLTPLQLLDYIGAIANGGKIYRPFLNASSTPSVSEDLTSLSPEIKEVQKGLRETVTSPAGTAYTMDDLPFPVCAKTGSAQVKNNQQENALFVGYAPCDNPQIAILILIENSKEGSLNAVPVAKDVLNWYYENRMKQL
jgi:penicillin-binding protein 2